MYISFAHQMQILRSDNLETEISINFGKFWKCGFYDWQLVAVDQEGNKTVLGKF